MTTDILMTLEERLTLLCTEQAGTPFDDPRFPVYQQAIDALQTVGAALHEAHAARSAAPLERDRMLEQFVRHYDCVVPSEQRAFAVGFLSELLHHAAALETDAMRWRKLLGAARVRVTGWARIGQPDGHMELALWGQHPLDAAERLVSDAGKEEVTRLVDGFALPAGR
jgi:hypothetical protein